MTCVISRRSVSLEYTEPSADVGARRRGEGSDLVIRQATHRLAQPYPTRIQCETYRASAHVFTLSFTQRARPSCRITLCCAEGRNEGQPCLSGSSARGGCHDRRTLSFHAVRCYPPASNRAARVIPAPGRARCNKKGPPDEVNPVALSIPYLAGAHLQMRAPPLTPTVRRLSSPVHPSRRSTSGLALPMAARSARSPAQSRITGSALPASVASCRRG